VFLFLNFFSLNNGGDGLHGVVNGVGGGSENNSIDILVVLVAFVAMVSVATLMSPQIIVQSHIEFFFHSSRLFLVLRFSFSSILCSYMHF